MGDSGSKKTAKKRRRRIRTAGITGLTVGSALMAAGATAVAITDKRTRKMTRKMRKRTARAA